MEIRAVSYRELLDDPMSPAMFSEYDEECSMPELENCHPHRELYAAMEKSGGMQCFGMYDEGVLIGFANLITWIVPHYSKKICSTESIFIGARHRSYSHWAALIGRLREFGKEKGAVLIQLTAPVGSRLSSLLALDADYRRSNDVFVGTL